VAGDMPAEISKCVVVAAPHTSNWDLYYMALGFHILDIPIHYTIKSTIIKGPFGYLLKKSGAVSIDRKGDSKLNRKSYIDQISDIIDNTNEIAMIVTPEGTRSKTSEWKTGFYYIATNTNTPIALGYLDYKNKEAGIGAIIYPTNFTTDMQKIMSFYRTVPPKYPNQFTLDRRYS